MSEPLKPPDDHFNKYVTKGWWGGNAMLWVNQSQVNTLCILRARFLLAMSRRYGGELSDLNTLSKEHADYFGQGLINETLHLTSFSHDKVGYHRSLKIAQSHYQMRGNVYMAARKNMDKWEFYTDEQGNQRVNFESLFSYGMDDRREIRRAGKRFLEMRNLAGRGLITRDFFETLFRMRVCYGRMASQIGFEDDRILSRSGFYDVAFSKTIFPVRRKLKMEDDAWKVVYRRHRDVLGDIVDRPLGEFHAYKT
jgi:hypothetical protein